MSLGCAARILGCAAPLLCVLQAGVSLHSSQELASVMNGSSLREALLAAARVRQAKKYVKMLSLEAGHGSVA